jgi:hypothetical protein
MQKMTKKNNFIYLFIALVVFLFSSTVVLEMPREIGEDVFSASAVLMLLVSIWSLHRDRTWKRSIYFLLFAYASLAIADKIFMSQVLVVLTLVTLVIFFVGSFWVSARQVLFEGEIDSNKIIGSISLYLLIGLIWAIIYIVLIIFDPGAFSGIEAGSWQQIFARVAYYSFVTLTTLGYGDILPKNHTAEFFVYMEAIVGVFYMAIIVSSLVSLRLNKLQSRKGKE